MGICHITRFQGPPTEAPIASGHHWIDELNKTAYTSVGVWSVSDWVMEGADISAFETTAQLDARDAAQQSTFDSQQGAQDALTAANALVVTTHIANQSNPHSTTFSQAVAADGGTDITPAEAEELTDASVTELHKHDKLYVPAGLISALTVQLNGDLQASAYPNSRNDGVTQQALATNSTTGLIERRTVLPFYWSQKIDTVYTNQSTTLLSQNLLSLVLPEDGTYSVEFFFIWSQNSGATDFVGSLRVDGVEVVGVLMEPQDTAGTGVTAQRLDSPGNTSTSGTDQKYPAKLEDDIILTAGPHTFDFLFAASTTFDTPTVYQSLIKVRRVK